MALATDGRRRIGRPVGVGGRARVRAAGRPHVQGRGLGVEKAAPSIGLQPSTGGGWDCSLGTPTLCDLP